MAPGWSAEGVPEREGSGFHIAIRAGADPAPARAVGTRAAPSAVPAPRPREEWTLGLPRPRAATPRYRLRTAEACSAADPPVALALAPRSAGVVHWTAHLCRPWRSARRAAPVRLRSRVRSRNARSAWRLHFRDRSPPRVRSRIVGRRS